MLKRHRHPAPPAESHWAVGIGAFALGDMIAAAVAVLFLALIGTGPVG
jgi:hypothetical protein